MKNQIDLMFERAFRTPFVWWDTQVGPAQEEVRSWFRPAVDVQEDDKAYFFSLDLPGLKKDEVKIGVENGILTVSGERRIEKNDQSKNWQRSERVWGQFHRKFQLPEGIELEKIEAQMSDGVLELTIPKAETQKPKLIEIKAK